MSATMSAPPAADPNAAAPPADDTDDNVVCTITSNGDGTFTVYAGDEPEGGDEGESVDDADAMGAAGDQAAPQGQQAASVGEALKLVMGILQKASTGGSAPGNAQDQFAAGFGGASAANPVAQKY